MLIQWLYQMRLKTLSNKAEQKRCSKRGPHKPKAESKPTAIPIEGVTAADKYVANCIASLPQNDDNLFKVSFHGNPCRFQLFVKANEEFFSSIFFHYFTIYRRLRYSRR